MRIEIDVSDGIMNELIRIHDNKSLLDVLEHRHELRKMYEPIINKCIQEYKNKKEENKKLGDQPS